jgi:hypothetical protein
VVCRGMMADCHFCPEHLPGPVGQNITIKVPGKHVVKCTNKPNVQCPFLNLIMFHLIKKFLRANKIQILDNRFPGQ